MSLLASRNITGGTELLTNPSFDSGLSNWVVNVGTNCSITAIDGAVRFVTDGTANADNTFMDQAVTTRDYPVVITLTVKFNAGGRAPIYWYNNQGGQIFRNDCMGAAGQTVTKRWISDGIKHRVSVLASSTGAGGSTDYEVQEVSVRPLHGGTPTEQRLISSSNPSKTVQRLIDIPTDKHYALWSSATTNYRPPLIDFTVEFTGNFNSISAGNSIITYSVDGNPNQGWKVDKFSSNNQFRFTTLGILDYVFIDNRINLSVYQRYAVTFNSSGTTLFVDGVKIGTIAGATPANPVDAGNFFRMRGGNMGLADVRIWDITLSDATIAAWAHKRVNLTHPNYTNLKMYYNMNKVGTNGIQDTINGYTINGVSLKPVYKLLE